MKIPSKIPSKLGMRGGTAPLFSGGPAAFNYAFNGLAFLSAASDKDYGKRRIRRSTAPFRKQQVDQQVNPGEQSLDGYWLRSQISFHGGAGLLYSDPGPENPRSDIRFKSSKNVDVWTQGQISLLNRTQFAAKTEDKEIVSITFTNGTAAVAGIQIGTVNVFTRDTSFVETTNATITELTRAITTDGVSMFVVTDLGIWKATIGASTIGAFTKIYQFASNSKSRIAWVKDRLILGLGPSLYELSPSPTPPPPPASALPSAFFTANVASWTWTSITETSGAIYAAGSSGSSGDILGFTIVVTGGVPTLTFGGVAAQLPGGEVPLAVFGYLGNFLAIGTNRGARVATTTTSGVQIEYGPLLFETPMPVLDFAGRDRFIYAGYTSSFNGETDIRIARIDLSLEIERLRFAWATDLVGDGDAGNTLSLAFCGGTDVLAFVTMTNIWMENETLRAEVGTLDTSRIRYSTLEPKIFRSIRVRGPLLTASLGVSLIDENGTVSPIHSFGAGQTPGTDDIVIQSPIQHDFLSFRFTLNASTDDISGSVVNGWQVKALPGSPRQRLVTLPLWCFDFEKDRNGQRVGGHRKAIARLKKLEELEASGNVVQWQDLDSDTAQDVFIESMEFEQTDPPPHFMGWGGIIYIQFRTI